MAATCKGMMQKQSSGVALMTPGVVLIILGVLIVIEPRVLVWVVAGALILLGTTMLVMASFMRRFVRGMSKHG
jgi:uncharacterized membrane protein HdeD (DUF308 family)